VQDLDKLTRVIINQEEIRDKIDWIFTEDDNILIPKDKFVLGDKTTLVYDIPATDEKIVTFLSIHNERRYKNLELEVEVEFAKIKTEYDQNLELIVRAVSGKNKTFIVDEYYAFGINKSRAYLAKVGYHESGDNSFAFKEMLNLSGDLDIPAFFKELSEDDQKNLNLDGLKYRYNVKYKFRLKIVDNFAWFYVDARPPIESFELTPQPVALFENINIRQGRKVVSRRNSKLDTIISSPEPTLSLEDEGMYGFSVPNSFVKLYRYEVVPLEESPIRLFDNEEYSREVTTDFNLTYRNVEEIRLNSNDSRHERKLEDIEVFEVKDDQAPLKQFMNKDDIELVQINDLEVIKDTHYVDGFVDIQVPLDVAHKGSKLCLFVDNEHLDAYGQKDEYFELGVGDGLNRTYSIPDEAIEKLKKYPNGKIGEIIVEVDDKYILNVNSRVGVQKDFNNFIDDVVLIDEFGGRHFYLETIFRGKDTFFDMGTIINGKLTFDIHPRFAQVNDTYNAVWNFNLANFIDGFLSNTQSLSKIIDEDIDLGDFTNITVSTFDLTLIEDLTTVDSFGYMMSVNIPEDVISLIESDIDPELVDAIDPIEPIPSLLMDILSHGMKKTHVQAILTMFKDRDDIYTRLFTDSVKRTEELRETIDHIDSTYTTPITADNSEVYADYLDFRDYWIRDLDHNVHSDCAIENRHFFTSLLPEEFGADLDICEITTVNPILTNKRIVMRIFYDTIDLVTNDHNITDPLYFVSDATKQLYQDTKGEKGAVALVEKFPSTSIHVMDGNDNIFFVAIPNKLFQSEDNLFADLTICSPYIENEEPVRRKVKAPLKKVSELLTLDNLTSTQIGEQYLPLTTGSETKVVGNRPSDDINFEAEVKDGDWLGYGTHDDILTCCEIPLSGFPTALAFSHDIPKMYPHPTFSTITESISGKVPILSNTWSDTNSVNVHGFKDDFFKNLFDAPASNDLIDQYLDMSKWYNTSDTTFGPFYKLVVDKITSIKAQNRVYNDRIVGESVNDLNSWFDGFYSGSLTPWVDTWPNNNTTDIVSSLDFGRLSGSPWGTQNSRSQMFDQLLTTIDDKFEEFTLFFIDLTQFTFYNRYALEKGINSRFIDSDIYPISGNNRIIDNPFVDPDLKEYVPFTDVLGDNDEIYFDTDDLRTFTNKMEEYPLETKDAFVDISDIVYTVDNVARDLKNSIDLLWGFNTSIVFTESSGVIQNGVDVNAEFEYTTDPCTEPNNDPYVITQKSNLGTMTGDPLQKFPNPDVFFRKNIIDSKVLKVWVDNFRSNNFDVILDKEGNTVVALNSPNPKSSSDVGIVYQASNNLIPKVQNFFLDNFDDVRDFKYITMTNGRFGYIKTENVYTGYIIDDQISESEKFYRKETMTQDEEGNTVVRTGGTALSKSLVRGIEYGNPNEDVLELINIKRSNNFEVKVDILFDDTIERNLMSAGIIFRGGFKLIGDTQYLNEFYAVKMNFEDNNLSLIQRRFNEDEVQDSGFLATVSDLSSIIQRGVIYTLRLKLVRDNLEVFMSERNQEQLFYFSYNLKTGKNDSGVEDVVTGIQGELGVQYTPPQFYLSGDRIGLITRSDKVYFTNLKLEPFEENNLTLNSTFKVEGFVGLISSLKNTHGISGDFKKIRKTVNGFVYLQIGETLLFKQGDGSYATHGNIVTNFEVIDKSVYVHERGQNNTRRVVNMYTGLMQLQPDFIVDGKSFLDEPMLAYLNDLSREVSLLEEKNGSVFITTKEVI